MEWKPIESAPQDEAFLAYEDGEMYKCIRTDAPWGFYPYGGQPMATWPEPTHWMPLPNPPV